MLSSALGHFCALGAGKHGHPEFWEMCVRGRDSGDVVSAHSNYSIYICLSHIFPWHLSTWQVSQMTMAFFIFSF